MSYLFEQVDFDYGFTVDIEAIARCAVSTDYDGRLARKAYSVEVASITVYAQDGGEIKDQSIIKEAMEFAETYVTANSDKVIGD